MFSGRYFNNIDAKGRCVIPAAFRHALGTHCILFTGPEDSLLGFSDDGWAAYRSSILDGKPYEDPDVRDLEFLLNNGMQVCEFDKQGRILFPKLHMECAGITKEVVFLGFTGRFEIYSREKYAERMRKTKPFSELLKSTQHYRSE